MNGLFPDFFIIGAAKSGPKSLFEYLKQHPGVFMPHDKEPGYFVCPEISLLNQGPGDRNLIRPIDTASKYSALSFQE